MTKSTGPALVPYGVSRSFGPDDPPAGTEHPTMLEYTYGRPGEERTHYGRPIEWWPNNPFEAVLVLVGMERGRSAARFVWRREGDGCRFPMFMVDALELLQLGRVVQGRTDSIRWYVRKRGTNYGIAVVPPEKV